MSAYTAEALLGTARIVFWGGLVLVVLPALLFPSLRDARAPRAQVLDRLVQGAFTAMVLGHLLTLLGVFDLFALLGAYAALHLVYLRVAAGRRPRAVLGGAWRRAVVASLDLLDRQIVAARRAGGPSSRAREWLGRRVLRGPDLAWMLLTAAVVLGAAALRVQDAILHPATSQADHYLHVRWLNALADQQDLWVDGFFPQGGLALLGVVQRLTALDHTLLARLAPGLAATLGVLVVLWTMRRLGASRPAYLGATGLYGVLAFAGWLPLASPVTGDVIAYEIGLVFLLPALLFVGLALGGRREARLTACLALGCAGLAHPVVGAIALGVAVVAAGACAASRALRPAAGVLGAAGFAAAVAAVPLGVALLLGRGPRERTIEDGFVEPRGFPVPAMEVPLGSTPYLAGAAAALLVLSAVRWGDASPEAGARRAVARVMALALLVVLVLVRPDVLGLDRLIDPAQAGRAASLVGAVVCGLLLDRIATLLRRLPIGRLRQMPGARWAAVAVTAAALGGTTLLARPSRPEAGPRLQSDEVVAALYAIKRDFPDRSWTVVDRPPAIVQVASRGFFFPADLFPTNYSPRRWQFDPRRPELALSTRHVLIFVRDGRRGRPSALGEWVREYRTIRSDLSTYRRDGDLTVFHIERTPEAERRINERVRRERRQEVNGRPGIDP